MFRKMHRLMFNKKGFTLIEVIVSLVLIGIMAAIAGMGLVKISEGYVFAKQNAETAQKAQIAIARIVKELGAATVINASPAPTGTLVNYTRAESSISPTPVTNNIMLSGSTVKIGLVGAETTLIGGVTGFTLAYYNAAGGSTATAADIRRIDVTLTLSGANNTSMPFDKISVFMQEAY
jgi:prepilin-type N-terminal cleavage/methylation domain-containing protein